MDEIYDDRDLHEYTDKELADLWNDFSDVSTTLTEENRNVLDQKWFGWKKGTEVLDVWHWFDKRFSTWLGKFMGKDNII